MKILMVSTEYPPMQGGVGRYSKKLVDSLIKEGIEVFVVCSKDGKGEFKVFLQIIRVILRSYRK